MSPYPVVQIVQDPRAAGAPRAGLARAQGGKLIKVYSNLQLFHTPGKRFFAETMCETQLLCRLRNFAPRRAAGGTPHRDLDVRVFVLRIEGIRISGCFSQS